MRLAPHRNRAWPQGLPAMDTATIAGGCAAFCTTVSYFPQLKKCWETGESGDLSLTMFSVLTVGIGLWILYGVLKSDPVIITANSISLTLLFGILYFKLREIISPRKAAR
jgi:MtN3 and saliva related transmembrane protein